MSNGSEHKDILVDDMYKYTTTTKPSTTLNPGVQLDTDNPYYHSSEGMFTDEFEEQDITPKQYQRFSSKSGIPTGVTAAQRTEMLRKVAFSRGMRLSMLRKLADLTIEELAKSLPVTLGTVSRLTRGLGCISTALADRLAKYFLQHNILVTKDWILDGGEEGPQKFKVDLLDVKHFLVDKLKANMDISGVDNLFSHLLSELFSSSYSDSVKIFASETLFGITNGDLVCGVNVSGQNMSTINGKVCIVNNKIRKVFIDGNNMILFDGTNMETLHNYPRIIAPISLHFKCQSTHADNTPLMVDV